jgi:large subunit ribosomal protein L4
MDFPEWEPHYLRIVEEFGFSEGKTKNALALLKALGLADKKVLVVFDEIVEKDILAFRNLPKVILTTVDMLGTYDTLLADVLLFTRSSLAALETVKKQPLGAARWKTQQLAEGGAA